MPKELGCVRGDYTVEDTMFNNTENIITKLLQYQ